MNRLLKWGVGFALLILLLREPEQARWTDEYTRHAAPVYTAPPVTLDAYDVPAVDRSGNLDALARELADHSRETAQHMIGVMVKLGDWFVN